MSDHTRSEAQANASRENGKNSHGPVTNEGKARSSMNALKHGFRSAKVVLAMESQELYDSLLTRYRAAFNPGNQPEYDTVVRMANAAWRLRRVWSMETAQLDLNFLITKAQIEANMKGITPELCGPETL